MLALNNKKIMTMRKIDLGDSLVKHPTYMVLDARCKEGLPFTSSMTPRCVFLDGMPYPASLWHRPWFSVSHNGWIHALLWRPSNRSSVVKTANMKGPVSVCRSSNHLSKFMVVIVPVGCALSNTDSTSPRTLNHCFKYSDTREFFNTLSPKRALSSRRVRVRPEYLDEVPRGTPVELRADHSW